MSTVINTALGPVEYDLAGGSGPVALASHSGLGGVGQARLLPGWLDGRLVTLGGKLLL